MNELNELQIQMLFHLLFNYHDELMYVWMCMMLWTKTFVNPKLGSIVLYMLMMITYRNESNLSVWFIAMP